jgi:P-type E1-E2 ATPase
VSRIGESGLPAGELVEPAPALRPGGLSPEEVRERVARGLTNAERARTSRSWAEILRANVLTPFNAILGALLVVVGFVGPPQDGLFGVVLVVNTAVGVAQELRAKHALDHLAIVNAPRAHVRRSGRVCDVASAEVVLDDVIEIRRGDQIVADCRLIDGGPLELDESLLTGEAAAVEKSVGDDVLSGSAVLSGTSVGRVIRVGSQAYAQRLQRAVQHYTPAYSEIRQGTNKILRVIGLLLIPVGAFLVSSQLLRTAVSTADALRGTVAGIGAMVPEGFILLATIAFALGALRLAQRRVLVQTLPAIEGLARADVVCIDKTGTLTTPEVEIGEVLVRHPDARRALAVFSAQAGGSDPTLRALATASVAPPAWRVVATVPFSSERKWSAIEVAGQGSWVLGGLDVLFGGALAADLLTELGGSALQQRGRLLALGTTAEHLSAGRLPAALVPAAVIELREHVREDAARVVGYLKDQGVQLKVISGDAPSSAAAVAERVGLDTHGGARDARSLPVDTDSEAFADAVEAATVIGRVRPEQKQEIVGALQRRGHVVAMTGDGVNDVPALKRADVGIAMGSGSQAARAVADVVLLDNAFATVPLVLGEGRRVIANVERVANLFLTKTVYACVIALVVAAVAVPYPFYPRQLTVVSSLTIGIPAFFVALEPGAPRAEAHFVPRVVRFALAGGTAAAAAALASYTVARGPQHATLAASRMAAVISLSVVSFAVLALVLRPCRGWRLVLLAAMPALGVAAVVLPFTENLFALAPPPASILLMAVLVSVAAILVSLPLLRRLSESSTRR